MDRSGLENRLPGSFMKVPNWVWPSLWTLFILGVCWVPAPWLGHAGVDEGGWTWNIPHLDKIIHLGLFAIFAILWARVDLPRRSSGWTVSLWIFGLGVILAILTEVVQDLPAIGRDSGLDDALADVAGLLVGFILSWLSAHRSASNFDPSQPQRKPSES
jgi:hypothetical protein